MWPKLSVKGPTNLSLQHAAASTKQSVMLWFEKIIFTQFKHFTLAIRVTSHFNVHWRCSCLNGHWRWGFQFGCKKKLKFWYSIHTHLIGHNLWTRTHSINLRINSTDKCESSSQSHVEGLCKRLSTCHSSI